MLLILYLASKLGWITIEIASNESFAHPSFTDKTEKFGSFGSCPKNCTPITFSRSIN